MYWVRLEWPADSTKRSRPSHVGSPGWCRMTFWNSRYAAGARLIAVPGCPLPTFCTASAVSSLVVSTARRSRSSHPALRATGRRNDELRFREVLDWGERVVDATVRSPHTEQQG